MIFDRGIPPRNAIGERFGVDNDSDADSYAKELTVGDITALTLFQARLPAPVLAAPNF